jgi:hypothetical protein
VSASALGTDASESSEGALGCSLHVSHAEHSHTLQQGNQKAKGNAVGMSSLTCCVCCRGPKYRGLREQGVSRNGWRNGGENAKGIKGEGHGGGVGEGEGGGGGGTKFFLAPPPAGPPKVVAFVLFLGAVGGGGSGDDGDGSNAAGNDDGDSDCGGDGDEGDGGDDGDGDGEREAPTGQHLLS